MFALAVVFAVGVVSQDFQAIAAASRVSPRPVECRSAYRGAAWFRQLPVTAARHCRALAAGYAALGTDAKRALAHAAVAEASRPGSPAAAVLRARAQFRLREFEAARASFVFAEERKEPSLVAAGFDYARVLTALGRWQEADVVFSRVLPLRSVLAPDTGAAAIVEAVTVALLAHGSAAVERCRGMLGPLPRTAKNADARTVLIALSGFLSTLHGESGSTRVPAAEPDVESFTAAARRQGMPGPLVELIAIWLTEPADAAGARARWRAVADGNAPGATLARRRLEVGG